MPAPRTSSRPGTSTRPVLTPSEARAVREALALRTTLATGQPLTAAQAAALRTATAAAKRTAPATSARRPAKRPPSGRSRTHGAPARRTGSGWAARLRVVALSTLLVPAAAALVLPGTPDGAGGDPLDPTALALTAQGSLLEDAGRYRDLEREVARAQTRLDQAHDREQAALAEVRARQQTVGATAADLYRASAQQRYPLLGLSLVDAETTSGALLELSVAERAREDLAGELVRTERSSASLALAGSQVRQAESTVEVARDRAEGVLAAVRSAVGGLTPDVTSALAGLGAAAATGPQQERDRQALTRWQGYLAQLGAAGIEPPAAAAIRDPHSLPPGLSPALDASGQPIPGVAWAIVGTSPVTVLPSETVAAVSAALSQLGKPFVPGAGGPDAFDCGGFTASSWLLAGYALPATPQDQWTTGSAVPLADLQIGDLVHAPGGQDVGIYLGDGDVIGASAATYRVSVRPMTAGSSAVRVVLPAPLQANEPLPVAAAGACGAPLPPPGERTAAWGGFGNGQIPADTLCRLGVHRHALRCDAAASYGQLDAAFTAAFGSPMCITDSYRSLGAQVAAFAAKPRLAAVPGTSNHGWGLAVDLCGGIHVAGSAQWTWMTANAARYGFVQPDWASPGGEKPEPWHWEFGYIS